MRHPKFLVSLLGLALLTASCATSTAAISTRTYTVREGSTLPFSRTVRVGNTVYVSGHLGLVDGKCPADPAAEADAMLDAFAASLGTAGLTMDHLVQVQIFCTDLSLYDTFNAVYRKRFGSEFPTRAFLGAGSMLRGCRFEIIGIAAD